MHTKKKLSEQERYTLAGLLLLLVAASQYRVLRTFGEVKMPGNKPGGVLLFPLPAAPDGRTFYPLKGTKFPNAVCFLDPGYHVGYANAAGHVDPAYKGIVGYWHTGVDMNGPGACNSDQGDTIHAARAGTIVFAGDGGGSWGPVIVQEVQAEGRTYWIRYAHAQSKLKSGSGLFPKVGAVVTAGQPLAGVGRGNAAHPWPCAHLHLDVFHTRPPSWGWWPTKGGPQSQVTAYCSDPEQWFKHLGAVSL